MSEHSAGSAPDVRSAARFDLGGFTGAGYDKGRSAIVQVLWLLFSTVLTRHWWCPLRVRIAVLRSFGATIGTNVLIRHDIKIHWPWKLEIGDNTWVGEGVWILNLEPVRIGSDTCISQGAMLCTGSHDRKNRTFEFDNQPIDVGDGVWIAARAMVLRGVSIGDNATVGAMTLVTRDVPAGATVFAPASINTDGTPELASRQAQGEST